MQVKVTRPFKCVPPGEVYPKLYAEGEIVDGRVAEVALSFKAGEPVKGGAKTPNQERKAAGLPPIDPPPAVVRARLTKQHTIKDVDGKEVKLARGIVVENDLAKQLIAEGVAEEIGADKT